MRKSSVLGIILSLVLMAGLLPGLVSPAQVGAADLTPTTELTITKHFADGTSTTVTANYTEMGMLPVQGDGETHYFMQGPTLDPGNLWDPDETLNLKDKGALMGTDVMHLCELVGGAAAGDAIKIQCSDGYNETFQYENVYTPLPQQGPMVICWYAKDVVDEETGALLYPDGAYPPEFDFGMRLVFFAQTTNAAGQHVFGNQDMKDCLPEDNWHTYYDGTTEYPSVNGISLKCVGAIDIYEGGTTEWELELSGAQDYLMTQTEFENGVACHGAVTWIDDEDNTWSGMPLWLLCGWVDDGNIHGPGAFNDTLASAGYDIKVIAADGYSYTFASADVARNNDIIVANQVNGEPLPPDKYPLKMVGPSPGSGWKVHQIARIELRNLPSVEEWELKLVGKGGYLMSQSEFESGVACEHGVTWVDGEDTWSGMPLWLLCGWVDDDVQHGEDAFNDDLAAAGYQVKVSAVDGFSYTFDSTLVARNDDIIVANTLNGSPLPKTGSKPTYPLKLVGPALTSGKQKVGQIASIELIIPWELELSGASDNIVSHTEFETKAAANPVSWDDDGDIWEGLALWRLAAIVDDDDPTTFNDTLAAIGYDINVIAADGWTKTFASADIARNDDRIVANILNGYPLPADKFPLRFVGPGLPGSQKVSQIVRIELINIPDLMEFDVEHMVINFTWLRPHAADTIIASGTFSLPEGATCDLASEDVSMEIDGVNITIPAGSFRKFLPRREIYTYSSPRGSGPHIWMRLNFKTGAWSLVVRGVDAAAIDSYDGVDVRLSIGSMVGAEHIDMYIGSLLYRAE